MKSFYLILWAALVACVSAQGVIYQLIAKENTQKSIVVSPFSIRTVLGMIYMGAKGRTAQELGQALKIPADKKEVDRKFRELVDRVQERENSTILKLANSIYVNDKILIRPEYNQAIEESFQGFALPIDLANGGDEAAKEINDWVLKQTDGLINDIVSADSLSPYVKVVVVNALYFQGRWEHEFFSHMTKNATFQITSSRSVSVPMMYQQAGFIAGDFPELQAKVLELPYENSNISMVIFLPYDADGLSALEEKIAGFTGPLKYTGVNVWLPKFKVEFSISLKTTLQKMGINDLFTSQADLSGILEENDGAHVDEVSHKAFIDVDETGTQAAAATTVKAAFLSAKNYKYHMDFMAVHPFAFVIRDEKNIYFQGRVVEP